MRSAAAALGARIASSMRCDIGDLEIVCAANVSTPPTADADNADPARSPHDPLRRHPVSWP